MSLVQKTSAFMAALHSILPTIKCFELAAQKRDAEALNLVTSTRQATRGNRFARWDIELQLLEAYLLLERGGCIEAQRALSEAFGRIKASANYNIDEKAILLRYGVSVLWLARGRPEPSCLLGIRHALNFNRRKVRGSLLRHFPDRDDTASD